MTADGSSGSLVPPKGHDVPEFSCYPDSGVLIMDSIRTGHVCNGAGRYDVLVGLFGGH